ncbi:MAG: cupin domain-containing protein, partial [Solirubrobacterales bacterium]|nr:cupin domain-containing protein [Solirubrobacterales bacterium]
CMTPRVPLIVKPGEGPSVRGPVGGPLLFKARAEQTGGTLTALENVIPPNEGPPVHIHAKQDEAWWVVEGSVRFRLGDDLATAPAGTFVFVPRGSAHAFRNDDATPARLLVLFTPAGMEPFFDGMGGLETIEPADFARLGSQVGMTVVGPPLGPPEP